MTPAGTSPRHLHPYQPARSLPECDENLLTGSMTGCRECGLPMSCPKSARLAGWRVGGGLQYDGQVLAHHERDRWVDGKGCRLDAAGDHQRQHGPGAIGIGQAEQACCRAMIGWPLAHDTDFAAVGGLSRQAATTRDQNFPAERSDAEPSG